VSRLKDEGKEGGSNIRRARLDVLPGVTRKSRARMRHRVAILVQRKKSIREARESRAPRKTARRLGWGEAEERKKFRNQACSTAEEIRRKGWSVALKHPRIEKP